MNMKKILKHASLVSLVSVCASVGFSLRAMRPKHIKGTHGSLRPERKLVSPAHGVAILGSGVLKKYYDFGPTDKDVRGNSTIRLIKDVFHAAPNSLRLHQTNSKHSIAYHFSPNIIAKLIGDSHRSRYENEKEQKCIDNYKNIILSDEGFKESTIKKNQKRIRGKVKRFSRTLVKSLQECGYYGTEKNPVYPEGMTHGILLAFLCSKVRGKRGIHCYFKALQDNMNSLLFIDREQKDLAYSKVVYSTAKDDIDFIVKKVERFSKKSNKNKEICWFFNKISYEDMVFSELVRPRKLPNFSQPEGITFYPGVTLISDCMETMIYDVCNLKLYDQKRNSFSLSKLPFKPDKKFKKFYKNNGDASKNLSHKYWASVVSNRPWVAYHCIVQTNTGDNNKKIGKLPEGFEGFIHGINKSFDLCEKVQVTFDYYDEDLLIDPQVYLFDQVAINQRKYIIIDPEKYFAFELQANITNVVVLLNMLLGLQLYEDTKIALLDERFDEKYFSALCNTLGWKCNIPKGKLKEKYRNKEMVTVELEVNSNSILFKWYMCVHGEVASRGSCMPPYRNKLLDYLVESLKNKTNESYSDLTSLFTLYYYPNEERFNKDREAFLDFPCLRRHLYFLQDLHDDKIKYSIIKTILEYEDDPYLFKLVRKLISSLAVNGERSYQEKMINLFFGMEDRKRRERLLGLFSGSLDQCYDVINGSKDIKKKVSLYKQAVLNNMYFKQAEDVVSEALKSEFVNVRMLGIELLGVLVRAGQAHEKAEEVLSEMDASTDKEQEAIICLKEALNQKFPQ